MISPQNVLRHELIGLDVLVSGASNPLHKGLSGRIIDETKNLVIIETPNGVKRIPKMHSRFQLHIPGSELVEIDGSVMVLAPEKRINLHEKKRIK
ncbi:MAG: ribonuclease P protein subunit [Methanoregula sp.]|jgi:ribonuclease P protein subunit POP4|nr:ribonuclease P protein subunit [Methanoregula sp.]